MTQQTTQSASRPDPYGRWLLAAILFSALASSLHVLATPEHFQEWVGYGIFFVIMAGAQALYAIALLYLGPRRWLLWAGIVGNGLIIGLYAITRTIGIPLFGPEAGEVETVGLLDAASKLTEVALIVCLARLLQSTSATEQLQA